jgi:hypothetical protein
MQIKKWLKTDTIALGITLGLIIPIPSAVIFIILLRLFQNYLHLFSTVRDMDILLLGLAVNLMVMRYYLVKLKFDKTGKSLMVLTVFMIVMFLIFLKNSNFVVPF